MCFDMADSFFIPIAVLLGVFFFDGKIISMSDIVSVEVGAVKLPRYCWRHRQVDESQEHTFVASYGVLERTGCEWLAGEAVIRVCR